MLHEAVVVLRVLGSIQKAGGLWMGVQLKLKVGGKWDRDDRWN